jgi:hypothetical protein
MVVVVHARNLCFLGLAFWESRHGNGHMGHGVCIWAVGGWVGCIRDIRETLDQRVCVRKGQNGACVCVDKNGGHGHGHGQSKKTFFSFLSFSFSLFKFCEIDFFFCASASEDRGGWGRVCVSYRLE